MSLDQRPSNVEPHWPSPEFADDDVYFEPFERYSLHDEAIEELYSGDRRASSAREADEAREGSTTPW